VQEMEAREEEVALATWRDEAAEESAAAARAAEAEARAERAEARAAQSEARAAQSEARAETWRDKAADAEDKAADAEDKAAEESERSEEAVARMAAAETTAAALENRAVAAERDRDQAQEEVSRLQKLLGETERAIKNRQQLQPPQPEQRRQAGKESKENGPAHARPEKPAGKPAIPALPRRREGLPLSTDGAADNHGRDAALREMPKAARVALERAEAAEDYARGLLEKLNTAELNVKMLRSQLYQKVNEVHEPTRRGAAKLPGKRYAPSVLPQIERGAAADSVVPYAGAGASPPPVKAKRPPMDLRTLEEGFDTSAFPNYGGKSRSGLLARPKGMGHKD